MRLRPCLSPIWVVYFLIAGFNFSKAHASLADSACWRALSNQTAIFRSTNAKRFAKRLKVYAAHGFEGFVVDALPEKKLLGTPYYLVKSEEFETLRAASELTSQLQIYFRRKLAARTNVSIEGRKFLDILKLALMDPLAWQRVLTDLREARGSAIAFETPLRLVKDNLPRELRQSLLHKFENYNAFARDSNAYPLSSPKRLADLYLKYIQRGDLVIKTALNQGASVEDAYRAYWNSVESVVQIPRPLSPDFVLRLLNDIRAVLEKTQTHNLRWQPEVVLFGSVPNARANTLTSDLDLALEGVTESTVTELKDRLIARLADAFPGHKMVISINNMNTSLLLQHQSVVFRVRPWRIEMLVSDLDDPEGVGTIVPHELLRAGRVDFIKR